MYMYMYTYMYMYIDMYIYHLVHISHRVSHMSLVTEVSHTVLLGVVAATRSLAQPAATVQKHAYMHTSCH